MTIDVVHWFIQPSYRIDLYYFYCINMLLQVWDHLHLAKPSRLLRLHHLLTRDAVLLQLCPLAEAAEGQFAYYSTCSKVTLNASGDMMHMTGIKAFVTVSL